VTENVKITPKMSKLNAQYSLMIMAKMSQNKLINQQTNFTKKTLNAQSAPRQNKNANLCGPWQTNG
jgi:hypothetical protein